VFDASGHPPDDEPPDDGFGDPDGVDGLVVVVTGLDAPGGEIFSVGVPVTTGPLGGGLEVDKVGTGTSEVVDPPPAAAAGWNSTSM
jgi:hypothetical protein